MTDMAQLPPITGDIAATAEVTINTKGGSVTATLKKSLRDRLGELSDHLSGAALQFASGPAVVLLAGAGAGMFAGARLRVRMTGRNRFEIEIEDDGDTEIDAVTAAFLRLKRDQFEKGLLDLSDPMSSDDLRHRAESELAEARRRIAEAGLAYPPAD